MLGEDHPDTLTSASNLAADLRELGDYQRARTLDEDTLARRDGCWARTTATQKKKEGGEREREKGEGREGKGGADRPGWASEPT